MFRLIGGCFVVCGGYALSRVLCAEGARPMHECSAALDFLRYVRVQIDCFCTPRQEIFATYRNTAWEKNGFLPILRQTGSLTCAVENSANALPAQVKELLQSFDAELGASYREEQIASCDFYAARLQEVLIKYEKELPNKCKVWRTVCLAGALLIVLLLL